MKHVIGSEGSTTSQSFSLTPMLLAGLRHELQSQSIEPDMGRLESHEATYAVVVATTNMTGGVPEELDVLAKRLAFQEGSPNVLFGTPLFVALAG